MKTPGWMVAIFLTGVALTLVVMPGILYAWCRAEIPNSRRQDLGWCVFIAIFASLVGPLGFVALLCLTGFAEHGWKSPLEAFRKQ